MVKDWRNGQRRPADIFGALLAQGFLNQAELRRALLEFSKVSGCGWAVSHAGRPRGLGGRIMNKPDFYPREHLEAMKRKAVAMDDVQRKLALLADAALRRLSPADRAAAFAEVRGKS
jgi:hypothetical protein